LNNIKLLPLIRKQKTKRRIKMDNLKSILIKRDNLTNDEADEVIRQAQIELNERIINNEDYDYFMEEYFGLEPK
jgi:hypothetical protein